MRTMMMALRACHRRRQARSPTRSKRCTARRCRGATATGTASPGNIRRDTYQDHVDQDFTSDIANACPSERQNFRVTLIGYLSMQSPDADHLATANRAIELAQKDIVTAFVRHKAAAKLACALACLSENLNSAMFHAINWPGDDRDYWYDVTVLSRHSGRDRRGRRAGRRGLLRADRAVRQAGEAGRCRAAGTGGADGAGPTGTGDPGSAE